MVSDGMLLWDDGRIDGAACDGFCTDGREEDIVFEGAERSTARRREFFVGAGAVVNLLERFGREHGEGMGLHSWVITIFVAK